MGSWAGWPQCRSRRIICIVGGVLTCHFIGLILSNICYWIATRHNRERNACLSVYVKKRQNIRALKSKNTGFKVLLYFYQPFLYVTSSVWKATSSKQNVNNLNSSQVRIEDWISSDMDPSKSKGTPPPPQYSNKQITANYVCRYFLHHWQWFDCCSPGTDSVDTAGSEISLQFDNLPAGSRRGSSSVVHSAPEFQYKIQGTLQPSRGQNHSCFSLYSTFLLMYIICIGFFCPKWVRQGNMCVELL